MISLFPITKIVATLCGIYSALMVIIFSVMGVTDISDNIVASFRYAFIFELLVLAIFISGWRYIWKWFPQLNSWLFPDINGIWHAEIQWKWNEKEGVKKGKVHIKQTFIGLSMELITDESESETLVVQPKRNPESERLQLFYIYRNTPSNTSSAKILPHIGTAILKFNPVDTSILVGNYYTDRNTKGVLKFTQSK